MYKETDFIQKFQKKNNGCSIGLIHGRVFVGKQGIFKTNLTKSAPIIAIEHTLSSLKNSNSYIFRDNNNIFRVNFSYFGFIPMVVNKMLKVMFKKRK